MYFAWTFLILTSFIFIYRFSGLFNTAPKRPNPSPVSIKYSGPQAGGNVRSPPEATAETSPGVVDRLDTMNIAHFWQVKCFEGQNLKNPLVVVVFYECYMVFIRIRQGGTH